MQEARRALNDLKLQAKQEYVSPTGIALIHAALGETDEAFRWLDKAYRARCGELFDLKVEPKFDSLRSDPRFDDLLRRVGLVE